jgi:hypothetical protein
VIQKEEDQYAKDVLLGLFAKKDRSSDTRQLLYLGDLRQILKEKPFSFLLFNQKVNNTMCAWTQDTFEYPLLSDIYFGDESEDDRSSSRQSSPQRKRPRVGNHLRKERATTRLDVEDAVEDERSEPDEDVGLSDLPSRAIRVNRTPSPSQVKKYEGIRVNRNPSPSQVKKYEGNRGFTDEEKSAIKEGVRDLGLGKWARIKELYKEELQDRTSGQIKVGRCFGGRPAFASMICWGGPHPALMFVVTGLLSNLASARRALKCLVLASSSMYILVLCFRKGAT